jgi:hypothetical protein
MMLEKLKKELANLPQGWIAMLETKADMLMEVNVNAVKLLSNKNCSVIMVSGVRPYNYLLNVYDKNKIDKKKIFIIDCICQGQIKGMGTIKTDENVEFLKSLAHLTDLSLAIDNTIKKINGEKVLFIDSISSFLIHNDPNTFTAFIHTILTKMRINMVSGLVISIVPGVDGKIRSNIVQLCDKVITI